jgi:transposase
MNAMNTTTIAVDLAKHVFEVAVATAGYAPVRHRFTRAQFERFIRSHAPAHVVMEACGTSHYWGRTAQGVGHRVTLLPAQYVRPFVRRQKTDRTDTAGLLDAVRSDGLKPVAVKTVVQQELLALHRIRNQWMATRTARINALRGFLREHGILVPSGARRGLVAVGRILEDAEAPVPGRLRRALALLVSEVREVEARIEVLERELRAVADQNPVIERLKEIPGVGLLTATALVASVAHIHGFHRARRFASWLGLTPREDSSADRRHLGAITKQGDVYLRCLLTHGARAMLLAARRAARLKRPLTWLQQWALAVADRRGHNRATIAVANKMARIIWAVWSRDVAFVARPAAA